MSLNNVTNLEEKNMVEIEFTVERSVFDAAVSKAYKSNVGKMNIPGFRKGKAPRNIIEKMYGKGVFYDEALNDVIPDAYEAALKESGAIAVSRPEFDVVSIDDGEDVVLKAKFYIKPEVVIEDYKGIEAERIITPVTDEDIDKDIERVRERNSRLIDITDRAAQDGDTAVIDYAGFDGDNQFEGGTAEGHELKLGSGQFIPGFEDQIIGKNVGDEFDVNVTFPEEYQAEELKGKPVVFKVKLNGIKFTELPELDDEFAKDVSEFDTFDEYKADVKAKIEERNSKASDSALDEILIDGLIAKMTVEVPDPMIDNESENLLRDYDNRLRMQGLDLNTYFRYTGMTLESMREQFKPQAERQVKAQLALEKIAELENIVAEEADIEEEYNNIAKNYSMEIDKVKESVTPDMLEGDLKLRKSLKFVRDSAVITDVEKKDEPVDENVVEETASEE
jgi:trigger factor